MTVGVHVLKTSIASLVNYRDIGVVIVVVVVVDVVAIVALSVAIVLLCFRPEITFAGLLL